VANVAEQTVLQGSIGAVVFKNDENGRLTIDLEGFFEHKCGGR
jgi:hypothetical protein